MSSLFLAITIIFVSVTTIASGQVISDTILPDGKKYQVHTILKGETLYSIAKKYQVSVQDLVALNPPAMNSLQPGQKLVIPPQPKKEVIYTPVREGNFLVHTVQHGQTLYSVAKKYSVSIETLRELNPELQEGLKAGQVLKIPAPEPDITEDTLFFSVAADTAREEKQVMHTKNSYTIACILPFFLPVNDTMSTGNLYGPPPVYNRSVPAINFYCGMLLALDSMKKTGMAAQLYVYDSENDTSRIKKILMENDSVISRADLVIGPFHAREFNLVSDFCSTRNIKLISPALTRNEILLEKPAVFKIRPSVASQLEHLGNFIVRNYAGKNILIVGNDNSTEKKRSAGIRNFMETAIKKMKDEIALVPGEKENVTRLATTELLVKEFTVKNPAEINITQYLSVSDTTIIIIPSSDQVFVSEILPRLNESAKGYYVLVAGLSDWENFDNIEIDYFHSLNVHLASHHSGNITEEPFKKFRHAYLNRFKIYPDDFSVNGFNITLFSLYYMGTYGTGFEDFLPEEPIPAIGTKYRFKQLGQGNGWENNFVFVIKYQNYGTVRVYPAQ